MAKVRETLNIGNSENLNMEELIRIFEEAYQDLAIAVNMKPDIYYKDTDGQTTDSFLNIGDININSGTAKVEIITAHPTPSTVTFTTI